MLKVDTYQDSTPYHPPILPSSHPSILPSSHPTLLLPHPLSLFLACLCVTSISKTCSILNLFLRSPDQLSRDSGRVLALVVRLLQLDLGGLTDAVSCESAGAVGRASLHLVKHKHVCSVRVPDGYVDHAMVCELSHRRESAPTFG